MLHTSFAKKCWLFYLLVMVIGCSKADDPPSPPIVPVEPKTALEKLLEKYELVWEDNFDGTVIDETKWKYRYVGSQRGYATVSANTISIDGKGNLVIQTTKDADGKYYVGQVTTDGIFTAKYGYFECRAQMHKYIGTHSAFWLQSNTMGIETNDPGKNGAEIDIFEYHKKTPDKVHHNLHWNGYGAGHQQEGTSVVINNIDKGFHTFGLLWTDKEYIFYVDGKETWRTSKGLSHIAEYMILSTELTGFGGDPNLGTYPDSVLFDYVKVYRPK
ncbi:MAG: glycoside hydrolase family 16 protein [Agriterribacter sp.]